MTFREDGETALDWAARYLERVGDFPVLAQAGGGGATRDTRHATESHF